MSKATKWPFPNTCGTWALPWCCVPQINLWPHSISNGDPVDCVLPWPHKKRPAWCTAATNPCALWDDSHPGLWVVAVTVGEDVTITCAWSIVTSFACSTVMILFYQHAWWSCKIASSISQVSAEFGIHTLITMHPVAVYCGRPSWELTDPVAPAVPCKEMPTDFLCRVGQSTNETGADFTPVGDNL